MDQMTVRIGAVWMLLNLVAAAFLGGEFIVQEIRRRFLSDDERDAETGFPHAAGTSAGPHA